MLGWVGIDPGAGGAIAVILESGEIFVHDWPGDERALTTLTWHLDLNYEIVKAVIEYQQPMPSNGSIASFKLGVNYGMWLMAAAARQWPLETVRPAVWKRGLGYPAKDYKASKVHSLKLARQRFPQAAQYLTRVKDDGRAEALLLAQYAKEGRA